MVQSDRVEWMFMRITDYDRSVSRVIHKQEE